MDLKCTAFVEFIVSTGVVLHGPEKGEQNSDSFTVQYDGGPWMLLLERDTTEAKVPRLGLECELLIGVRPDGSRAIIGVKSPDATAFTATTEITAFAGT